MDKKAVAGYGIYSQLFQMTEIQNLLTILKNSNYVIFKMLLITYRTII